MIRFCNLCVLPSDQTLNRLYVFWLTHFFTDQKSQNWQATQFAACLQGPVLFPFRIYFSSNGFSKAAWWVDSTGLGWNLDNSKRTLSFKYSISKHSRWKCFATSFLVYVCGCLDALRCFRPAQPPVCASMWKRLRNSQAIWKHNWPFPVFRMLVAHYQMTGFDLKEKNFYQNYQKIRKQA